MILSFSGKHYHEEHGNEWPGKEDPGPGLKNPSPKDALLVVLAMALLLAFLKGFFEKYVIFDLLLEQRPITFSYSPCPHLYLLLLKIQLPNFASLN